MKNDTNFTEKQRKLLEAYAKYETKKAAGEEIGVDRFMAWQILQRAKKNIEKSKKTLELVDKLDIDPEDI